MSNIVSLMSLPNELLLHILTPIRTLELFPLSVLSHRFHCLVVRILKHRLSTAASLCGHTLLLECFHPSARLTQPALLCSYIGTRGLDDANSDQNEHEETISPREELRNLRELYSSYTPHRGLVERKLPRRHPAGDIPGSRTYTPQPVVQVHNELSNSPSSAGEIPGSSETQQDPAPVPAPEPIIQRVHLDGSELFSQLCAQTIVALTGPKPGLYFNQVDVSNGIIRVWRKWLAKQEVTIETPRREKRDSGCSTDGRDNKNDYMSLNRNNNMDEVLWVNDGENVGVHFRVKKCTWRRDVPVIFASDDDVPVSYELEYEELMVRTMHLLIKMEETTMEDPNVSRKAIVYGSYA